MADAVGTHFSPEIAAGGFSRVDGTVQFWQRVGALIGPQSVVLDFGAGRGAKQSEDLVSYRRGLLSLKGRVRDLIGVDVDPVVITNEALDRAFVITPDGELPIPDQSIDVVVSDFVFEHIQDPAMAARELDRVLKPGGWICARTPNRHGYIALGNRLIPDSLHARIIRSAQDAREEKDVFPAVYRLNSTSASGSTFRPPATISTSFRGTRSRPTISDRSCSIRSSWRSSTARRRHSRRC